MSTKSEIYADLHKQIASVIAGETSQTARYASAACLLRDAFGDRFFWTGFYVVDPLKPEELVVGPYQGTLGCLRIPFGRGVCGAAAPRSRFRRRAPAALRPSRRPPACSLPDGATWSWRAAWTPWRG